MFYNRTIRTEVPAGYELVWHDEFDGETLDRTKWGFHPHMHDQPDLQLYDDERAVTVGDSCVTLTARRVSDTVYSTNISLTTANTMVFKYGYLVMSAKIPYRKPAFPSFWMQSSRERAKAPEVMGEIDILEYFGTEIPHVQTGIHAWSRKPGQHSLYPSVARASFEDTFGAEDFHTYAMEWTPEYLRFFVDGQEYHRIDITPSATFCDWTGTECFHDYYYMIFNNYVQTLAFNKGPNPVNATPDDVFPIDYKIDWVRLYQKPGEGDLILLKQ